MCLPSGSWGWRRLHASQRILRFGRGWFIDRSRPFLVVGLKLMRRDVSQVERIQFTQVCETGALIEVDRFLLSRRRRLQTIVRWAIRSAAGAWAPAVLCRTRGR